MPTGESLGEKIPESGVKSIAKKNRAFYVPNIEAVGVYMLENVETKKRYIGSTVNLKKRLAGYERSIRLGWSINAKIDSDIAEGHSNFFAVILETFPDGTITNSELKHIELQYIREFGTESEYNFNSRADRGRYGRADPLLYAKGTLARCKKRGC